MIIKSDFQDILPEDCRQYNEIFKRYIHLATEDGEEAFKLMKKTITLAQRWSEIEATARKIKGAAEKDFSLTEFKNWAHQRHSIMKELHTDCRMIWKECNEFELSQKKNRRGEET